MQYQATQHEVLIVDSLWTSLVVADEEVPAIKQFLESICGHLQVSYDVFGRRLEVVKAIPGVPKRGTTFADRGERSCDARIVLRCPDEPRKEVHVRYTLAYHAVARRTKLIAQFNPATIVAGNNVRPVAIPEPWRAESPAWPSSSLRVFGSMLRLGYDLLDALHAQAFKGQRLFSKSSAAIRAGRFRVLRAQWASYIPTPDRLGFLQLLPALYGHTILSGKGTINTADHLGLIFDPYPRDGTEKQTGVVLQKRHGKKPAWSVEFYDKRARVAQMKQLKTLTEAEIAIISSSVRLDVTAHPPGIISICKAAQRRMEEFSEPCSWSTEFVEGSPEATAWWLERAVVALSCEMDGGRVVRRSFAAWLLPKMLGEVTHLRALANFTRAGFRQLCELDDPVAAAWREIERPKRASLISELIARSKLKRATIYKRRRLWLDQFNIDILVPCGFYRDLLFYGPNSVMEVSERRDMVRAVDRKDGDASVRMLRQAARRFDEARRAVLRPAMEAKPRELPVLVPRRALAYSLPKQEGEDDEAWRSPDASLFGRRKVEERLSLIREDLRKSLRESRLRRQPTL
jgi:hypothetical protein